MTKFEDFIDDALWMGMGRIAGRARQVPLFMPKGSYQNQLLEKAINHLKDIGFHVMDLRDRAYEEAVEAFSLEWPPLFDKWPYEEFSSVVKEDEKKLLIACGKESHPRFWKYLCKDSLLYTGSALPPVRHISPRCIVIPDSACVTVIVKAEDFHDNYPMEFFGAVGTFNSNTVPFHI